jgi:hypothetical protein
MDRASALKYVKGNKPLYRQTLVKVLDTSAEYERATPYLYVLDLTPLGYDSNEGHVRITVASG